MSHGEFFRALSSLCDRQAVYTLAYCLEAARVIDTTCDAGGCNCIKARRRRLIVTVSPQGTIFDIEPQIARRLGYTAQELIGRNIFAAFPPQIRASRWKVHQRAVLTGRPVEAHDEGPQGHRYDSLAVPVIRGDVVTHVLVFALEEREFIEIGPDGTRQPI